MSGLVKTILRVDLHALVRARANTDFATPPTILEAWLMDHIFPSVLNQNGTVNFGFYQRPFHVSDRNSSWTPHVRSALGVELR
jgi:hypothetical protein